MAYETIIYDTPEDGIARITLNRPEADNAMSVKLVQELRAAAKEAADDDGVGVLVYRANGPSFCAGKDFKEGPALKHASGVTESLLGPEGPGPLTWLHPKCTIAQVQGLALGGGDLLASGCDITIASEDARFGFPEARWGFPAARNGGWFWNWLIGPKKTKEYMLSGRNMTAEEACRIGLINEVVPLAKLEETVMSLAHDIAEMHRRYPGAIQTNKALINSQHPELDRFFDGRLWADRQFATEYAARSAGAGKLDEILAEKGVRGQDH